MLLQVGSCLPAASKWCGPTSNPLNPNFLGAGPRYLQCHARTLLKWPQACSQVTVLTHPLLVCTHQNVGGSRWEAQQLPLSLGFLLCKAGSGRGRMDLQHRDWPVTPVTLTSVTADECFNDRNKREIPVALGLSIAGLLGVLLTACLVARERPGRGYERM